MFCGAEEGRAGRGGGCEGSNGRRRRQRQRQARRQWRRQVAAAARRSRLRLCQCDRAARWVRCRPHSPLLWARGWWPARPRPETAPISLENYSGSRHTAAAAIPQQPLRRPAAAGPALFAARAPPLACLLVGISLRDGWRAQLGAARRRPAGIAVVRLGRADTMVHQPSLQPGQSARDAPTTKITISPGAGCTGPAAACDRHAAGRAVGQRLGGSANPQLPAAAHAKAAQVNLTSSTDH